MHFVAGSCTNGDLCDYCHLSHNTRPTHLDKRRAWQLVDGFHHRPSGYIVGLVGITMGLGRCMSR